MYPTHNLIQAAVDRAVDDHGHVEDMLDKAETSIGQGDADEAQEIIGDIVDDDLAEDQVSRFDSICSDIQRHLQP
jgi:hypothetical protein